MTTLPWNLFKQVLILTGKRFHYVDSVDQYYIFSTDVSCFINKNPSSDDLVDWETNFKSTANDPESRLSPLQGGRLKTTTLIENPLTVATIDPMFFSSYLLNGPASEMAVNGAIVNANFTSSIPSGNELYFLKSISCYIMDNAIPESNEFGGLAGLANGVQLKIKSKGSEYIVDNFRDNSSLMTSFSANPVYSIYPGSGLAPVERFVYAGTLNFSLPIVLRGGDGDYVRATIRDNLTGLTSFKMKLLAYRGI